jgi:hypothetical protein
MKTIPPSSSLSIIIIAHFDVLKSVPENIDAKGNAIPEQFVEPIDMLPVRYEHNLHIRKETPYVLVRKRIISTDRPPLVDEI